MNQCHHSLESATSIWHAMKWAQEVLEANERPDAQIDAKLLMLYVLEYNESQLLLNRHKGMSSDQLERYRGYVLTRATGIPLQHITHEQEFMGLNFYVSEDVLIPRQDTETLVEKLLEINKTVDFRIGIDIGTGSGCIGISLAHYIKGLRMTLIDVSDKALEVARYNVKEHGLEEVITTLKSDILSAYKGEKVDFIVSNPPYIAKEDMADLMIEVKEYEPHLALTDEGDGLYFYRVISKVAKNYLKKEGFLAYEIGYNQGEAVTTILENEGYESIELFQDLAGNNRVIIAKNK